MLTYLKNFFRESKSKEQYYYPKLYIFTGAGISADSGLNTYRGNSDNSNAPLWKQYDVKKYSSYQNWYNNKEQLFEFWSARKEEMINATPNLAHIGIAKLQALYCDRIFVATQNIDTLFEQAGAKNILHVHGDIEHMECKNCSHYWYIGQQLYYQHSICPQCHSDKVKPAIVLFGENAPKYRTLYDTFNFRKIKNQDIIVCIGTSFQVCKLDNIIGYGQYQPGFKILANYEKIPNIDDSRFNYTAFGKIVDHWENIENLINDKMKPILIKNI